MKILVTGATGFIGKHLVRKLLSDRHEVHILIRPDTDQEQLEPTIVHTHLGSTQNMIDTIQDTSSIAARKLIDKWVAEEQDMSIAAE